TTTTIITFLMVFLIQNAQNRDAASMQSKLDELIRSHREARNEYIGIEHLTEKELEKIRADLEQQCDQGQDVRTGQVASLNHLIRRR
ncbi:MAG: low affinity iron permease family protein, partial [Sphingomonas sp.]|nr:low affinity iron permease family protein [Sphingomonas sp.]